MLIRELDDEDAGRELTRKERLVGRSRQGGVENDGEETKRDHFAKDAGASTRVVTSCANRVT